MSAVFAAFTWWQWGLTAIVAGTVALAVLWTAFALAGLVMHLRTADHLAALDDGDDYDLD